MGMVKADLFVTCIVDQLFPWVGVSAVRVLRGLGVLVGFPEGQTCCGQAVYNAGFRGAARDLAARTVGALEGGSYVVVPSGSCAAMMRVFYLDLFEDDPEMLVRAQGLAGRVFEFSEFVSGVLGGDGGGIGMRGTAAFHPGCHLLRELGVREAPYSLLQGAPGLAVRELRDAESCCGFGGGFSVKLPHISEAMLADKVSAVVDSGAEVLVSCDMSCLMHIGGGLRRQGAGVGIRHIAEVLDPEGGWRGDRAGRG